MRIKSTYIVSMFALAACLVGFLAYAPSASAALEGENGPIVYTDNNTGQNNENDEVKAEAQKPPVELNEVITTSPDGTNQQVVAESEDKITTAGISGPTAENNYDIAYATEAKDDCAKYEKTCAVVNKVTTDENGTVVTTPEVLAELPSLVNGTKYNKSESWVNNLSYSPDGETVLATQYSTKFLDAKSAVVTINNETGTTTTVVAPSFDPYLNAGYADNGTIYYSKTTGLNTDIWYITPDDPTPKKLTNSTKVSEYFIDVSPDNSKILVADVKSLTCFNAYGMLANRYQQDYSSCDYYFVNTADGSILPVAGLPKEYMPAYFSPDNTMLIGTLFEKQNTQAFKGYNNHRYTAVGTATFDIATHEVAVITDQVGVKQWAPKVVLADETVVVTETQATPTVVVATATTKTLPSTGVSINALAYLIAGLLVVASLSIMPSILSNKK